MSPACSASDIRLDCVRSGETGIKMFCTFWFSTRASRTTTLACILFSSVLRVAAASEHVIIFTNSSRNLDEFRAFAKSASRMKRYGRVQIDIGVLAEKATFEVPPGGEEWHQYAAFNANLSKFFPSSEDRPILSAGMGGEKSRVAARQSGHPAGLPTGSRDV